MHQEDSAILDKKSEQTPIQVKERKWLEAIIFSKDGQYILTGSFRDKEIFIWDYNGNFSRKITLPYIGFTVSNATQSLAVSQDGQIVIVGGVDGYIQALAIETGVRKYLIDVSKVLVRGNPGSYHSISLINSNDHKYIYYGSKDIVVMQDFQTGNFINYLCDPTRDEGTIWNALPLVHSYKNSLLAGGCDRLKLWDTRSKEIVLKFSETTAEIRDVIFSHDDKYLISGSWDSAIRIWDIRSKKLLKKIEGNYTTIPSLKITSDDRYIFLSTCSEIQVFDTKLNVFSKTLSCSSTILALNNDYLVSNVADSSKAMRIWNIRDFLKNEEKFFYPDTESTENWLLKEYLKTLEDSRYLSVDLLRLMFDKVSNVREFKFPYTLLLIEIGENRIKKEDIYSNIDKCLVNLAETCTKGSHYCAEYKIILDSVEKEGIIDKVRRYYLEIKATTNTALSDERFKTLERQVYILKRQIEVNCQNIDMIAADLKNLKNSLRKNVKRDILLSLAKIALTFMGNGIVDFLASIVNFASLSDIGALVLSIKPSEMEDLLKKGVTALQESMDSVAGAITKIGYDPGELVQLWVEASIVIKQVPEESKFNLETDSRDPTSSSSVSSSSTDAPAPLMQELLKFNIQRYHILKQKQKIESSSQSLAELQKKLDESEKNIEKILERILEIPDRKLESTTPIPIKSELSTLSPKKTSITESFIAMRSPVMPSMAKPSLTACQARTSQTKLSEVLDKKGEHLPIHEAIAKNKGVEAIKKLLETHKEVNVKNAFEKTPIMLAAEKGQVAVVELLIKNGAGGNTAEYITLAKRNAQSTSSAESRFQM